MKLSDFQDLSIGAVHALYQSGTVTPAELIGAIYDRIEAHPLNPTWISLVSREDAVARARGLGDSSRLPLYGIPFAVKDNLDVAGNPTTAGCPAFAFTPEADAFVVARLRQAGAILIGKTNLDQFATGLVGTRSPYGACASVFDGQYISGGSSSGSAIAVASGLVTFSLGTDTAGSGRVPAAFNNIVGLKPSRGLISASGVVPACRSLDCVSIFCLSCSDASAVFEAARAIDPEDPFSRATSPVAKQSECLRIGVLKSEQLEFFGNREYERLYTEIVVSLKGAGCSLVEVDLSPFRAAAELLYSGPYVAERFAAVGAFVKNNIDKVEPIVASIITASENWSAAEAYQALYQLEALKSETAQVWRHMDALLLPTAPTIYKIGEVYADPAGLNSRLGYYTNFVNLLDLCGVAVPAGFTREGLPFGVTAIGQAFSEASLLAFCHRIQKQRSPVAGLNLSVIGDFSVKNQASEGWVLLSVVGAHLSGQPLNHQLVDRGAKFVRTTITASDYRCFALTNTAPPKPGLLRTPGFSGPGIETEIWAIHESQFGSFVGAVPPPLSIGTCELSDGSLVKGFLCEPYATAGMPEITQLGGWRSFLSTIK